MLFMLHLCSGFITGSQESTFCIHFCLLGPVRFVRKTESPTEDKWISETITQGMLLGKFKVLSKSYICKMLWNYIIGTGGIINVGCQNGQWQSSKIDTDCLKLLENKCSKGVSSAVTKKKT